MDILFIVVFFFMLIIVIMGCAIFIAYSWLQPVMPYLTAKWNKKDLVVLIGKDNKVRFIPAKYSSGVYATSKPPYSFIQRVPAAYRLGEINCVFVHDGWGVVIDPDMAEALRVLGENGYTTYESLDEAVHRGDLREDDLIRIHAFKDLEFHNILNYVADITGGEVKAHMDERMAEFLEQYKLLGAAMGNQQGSMNMYFYMIMIAIIALVALKQFNMI